MLKKIIRRYSSLFLLLIFLFFTTRVIEFFFLYSLTAIPEKSWVCFLLGFLYDLSVASIICSILLFLFLILSRLGYKFVFSFAKIIIFTIGLINLSLILYFTQQLSPLDHVVFKYSIDDYLVIFSWTEYSFIACLFFIIGLYFGIKVVLKFRLSSLKIGWFFACLGLGLVFTPHSLSPKPTHFELVIQEYITANKLGYFINSIKSNVKKEITVPLINLTKSINDFHSLYPEKKFISSEYPLLHTNTSEDLLSDYFDFNTSPPNIVFIIMESLSRSYSGKNAYLGSMTPFLDSLSDHGIYFENFISLGERTFCVLQNILGSLPYGKRGFQALSPNYPKHNTMLSVLDDDYSSAFFYSDDAHFGKMDDFLNFQEIDIIVDREKMIHYNKNLTWLGDDKNEVSFGRISDKDLFSTGIQYLKNNNKSPYLHTYLSLTMHYPFLIPNKDDWIDSLRNYVAKLNIKETTRKQLLKHKVEMSTALFVDNALKSFFNSYKSIPGFENTIFIITGDHKLGTMPHKSKLDVYHVPLLIYSPLLKKTSSIKALNTHLDIAPSLLLMLEKNFNIKTPENIHWLGGPFNLSELFTSNKTAVSMLNNRDVVDAVFNEYYLSKNVLYKISDGLKLNTVKNDSLQRWYKEKLESSKIVNQYVCYNDKITPPIKTDYNYLINKTWSFESPLKDSLLFINPDETYHFFINEVFENPINAQLKFNCSFYCEKDKLIWPLLSVSVKNDKGEQLSWKKYLFNEHYYTSEKKERYNFMISTPLKTFNKNDIINVSLWNNNSVPVYIHNVTLQLTENK